MCGCVHNACVTGLCRWLLCVCMRVYIVQGWDMEAQDLGVCLSGLLSAWTWACGLCSVHVTACSTNRISCVSVTLPPFLCVSALFFFHCGTEGLCKHMRVWSLCTSDLNEFVPLSTWLYV